MDKPIVSNLIFFTQPAEKACLVRKMETDCNLATTTTAAAGINVAWGLICPTKYFCFLFILLLSPVSSPLPPHLSALRVTELPLTDVSPQDDWHQTGARFSSWGSQEELGSSCCGTSLVILQLEFRERLCERVHTLRIPSKQPFTQFLHYRMQPLATIAIWGGKKKKMKLENGKVWCLFILFSQIKRKYSCWIITGKKIKAQSIYQYQSCSSQNIRWIIALYEFWNAVKKSKL